jgi:hypothetical protein
MDPQHPSFDLCMNGLKNSGYIPLKYFYSGNWYLPCEGLSFDHYLATRPSKTRHTLQRKKNAFLRENRGRIQIFSATSDVEHITKAWTEIYNASWKTPEPFPHFIPELISMCARRGWLRMGIAYYDEKPIAAQIWIVHNQRAAIYKLAYDQPHAKHSAGTILTGHLMQYALDIDKVHSVDYLLGDDSYKKEWVTHRRERWGIVAYNPRTLRGFIGLIKENLGRSTKDFLKTIQNHSKK